MPLPCDSDESSSDNDLDKSDEFIRLSEVSEADILSIIKQMVPDAPFLKISWQINYKMVMANMQKAEDGKRV